MEMTIDEAIKQLETYTIPCGKYKVAYDLAVETMRKYQKIQQIVKEWEFDHESMVDSMEKISEVLHKGVDRMRIRQVGEYEVSDKGVELVVDVGDCGTYTTKMVLPKEIFIECYNKWIKEQTDD